MTSVLKNKTKQKKLWFIFLDTAHIPQAILTLDLFLLTSNVVGITVQMSYNEQ
jgi:hypothetical protein